MKCIVCGRNAPALGGLCAPCLGERRRFIGVPEFCELTVCAHCGSVHRGRRWENSRGEMSELEDAARRSLRVVKEEGVSVSPKVSVVPVDGHNADAEIESTIRIGKSRLVQSGRTRIRIRRAVCERCSKIHGKYYEAILQVRAQGRDLTSQELELVRSRVAALVQGADRGDYIREEREVDGGLDFQLGKLLRGKAIVRTLARELGGRVTESSKLAGNREGRELYRVTFLLRLPALRGGDFVGLDGRILLVTHVGPQGTSATDLSSGRPETLDPRAEERARRLGGSELVEVAVVLDARMPELTLMDPVGYRPVTVIAPEWFWSRPRPENVRILKAGEEVFLVPDG